MRGLVIALMLLVAGAAHAQGNPLVGVWRGQYNDPVGGPQLVEVVIQANGTYSQQFRGATTLNTFVGRYGFLGGSLMRFEIDDWAPKEWCGPRGCADVLKPPGSIVDIQFNGPNQFAARDTRTGQVLVYSRAQ